VIPHWLTAEAVRVIHAEQIETHGGLPGVKDDQALEAALSRPPQLYAYHPEMTIPELAAAYGFSICRVRHPFNDGNKRMGLLSVYMFLADNGFVLTASSASAVRAFRDMAAGTLSERAFTAWVVENCSPVQD